MNGHQDWLAGKIDRNRAKVADTARAVKVRDMAKLAVNAFVTGLPEEDRAEAMRGAVIHLRTLYGAGEGERAAVSLFGSMAWSAELQTRAAVARAEAARLFTKAANDRGDA